jgi:uncharacterized protein
MTRTGTLNDPTAIQTMLEKARTIAVVGCSPRPDRPSNQIARYLLRSGYVVVPVNPAASEILGQRCYPDLDAVDPALAIDCVDVFRRPELVPNVADQAIRRGVPFVFLQEGVVDAASARRLQEAGIDVAMDRCILKEHVRLVPTT